MKSTDSPIKIEETFEVSADLLWNALTNREEMIQWFFENIKEFEPKVGFETKFVISNEERVFPHLWKVTEVEHLKKITINWKYEGFEGDSHVSFELFDEGQKTQLKLTHTVTEDFPSDIPEFARESCIGGWNYFIKERLRDYIK